jgi:poly(A) polymerase
MARVMINLNEPRLPTESIDPNAMDIIEALQERGFKAYLVGGCVRDLLIGLEPKDYDIATDARPNQVRQCVNGAYVIGKRFRLVLVKRGLQQYEVTTFRREAKEEEISDDPRKLENMFGSPEEDAKRRDFTINALFYDPISHELLDYVNGVADLKSGFVRMIGDPKTRFEEDPIRILRALRLAHKIRFRLDWDLRAAIPECAHLLPATALPRRREEYLKLLRLNDPCAALVEAYDTGALQAMAPTFAGYFSQLKEADDFLERFKKLKGMSPTDWSPPELFAMLTNALYRSFFCNDLKHPVKGHELMEHEVLGRIMRDELGVFKLESHVILGALHVQSLLLKRSEFESRGPRRREAILNSESFPLALDLLAREGDAPADVVKYWQDLARVKPAGRTHEGGGRARRQRRRKAKAGSNTIMSDELLTGMDDAD